MRLNYRRTFFIGLAFLSISAFWQIYDNLIPLMLKNTFLLGETLTGAIMAMDNVLALFLLPIFGALSDKVETKRGKRMPFVVLGTTVAVASMMIIPIADQSGNFLLFIAALGVALVAMGTYRSPAVALMPDLTPKPLRSKANAVINLMGAVGGIYALAMISLLIKEVERPNYTAVFAAVAVLMIFCIVVLILTIHENPMKKEIEGLSGDEVEKDREKKSRMEPEVRRSLYYLLASIFLWFAAYNAVTTAFSRYATTVWELQGGRFASALIVGVGAAVLSFIPIGIISEKTGRKKMILIGIILMTLSYTAGFFFVRYSPLINVVFVFTGFGWASINVNSYPMVVEMSKSSDVGKYTGLYYTFSMSAQIFTPILSGFLLENISYRTLFPYAVGFSLLSFLTMIRVGHGDVKKSQGETF